jgi:oxygen-dependent protoporphyrinogen oxidase
VTERASTIVIGGGISGLACVYSLRKSGIDALLLEASPRPGGVIHSELREGFLIECGPQSFSSTEALFDLVQDLGIAEQIVQAPSRAPRYVLVEGKLQAVPLSPPAFLTSSLVGFRTKWSILSEPLRHGSPPEDDESIADFARRKFTSELLDRLLGPFVSGIYAGDPEKLSLRGAFPALHDAEKASGSLVRGMIRNAKKNAGPRHKPTLISFHAGNETLVRALADRLGGAFHPSAGVSEIRSTGPDSFHLTIQENGATRECLASRLVLATPSAAAARLVSNLLPQIVPSLNEISYAPVAVVSLGYRREDVENPLSGFGFLIPRSANLRTLGCVWNSSLFPNRAPQGHVLLTSFVGGATDPSAIELSEEALSNLVHAELAPILSLRKPAVFSNVAFYPRAIPQYNLGHSRRVAAIESARSACPSLWFAGSFFRGPAVGACIDRALTVAEEIRSSYAP